MIPNKISRGNNIRFESGINRRKLLNIWMKIFGTILILNEISFSTDLFWKWAGYITSIPISADLINTSVTLIWVPLHMQFKITILEKFSLNKYKFQFIALLNLS